MELADVSHEQSAKGSIPSRLFLSQGKSSSLASLLRSYRAEL